MANGSPGVAGGKLLIEQCSKGDSAAFAALQSYFPRTPTMKDVFKNGSYAAKLLFQIRFDRERKSAYRMAEERILLLQAMNANEAYNSFAKMGKSENRTSINDDGQRYFFEFIGIVDMIHLDIECQDNEVWYSMKGLKNPMERKKELVPGKKHLAAFKYEKLLRRPWRQTQ